MNILTPIRDLFSPVLSDRSIKKYMEKGLLITTPISKNQLQPNSVDLTLGYTYKKLRPNAVRFSEMIDPKFEMIYDSGEIYERYVLKPGEFILMASNEELNIPNGIISFVQGRSSIARLGIQTEQAGLIDAGFKGTITFEVFNQTEYDIYLYPGMRIAQLYFFKAEKADRPYGSNGKGSKYQKQIEATGSRINNDPELKRRV